MFSRRRRTATKSHNTSYCHLENRRLLAGNVNVAFIDGNVFLRGDNADNSVEAVRVRLSTNGNFSASDLVIRGLDGTTINGQSEFVLPKDGAPAVFTNGFRVNLGGGNDFMRFEGIAETGTTRFYGGPGNDSFSFYRSSFNDLTIQTFTGDDSVSLDRVSIGQRLRIFTLAGDDTVTTDSVNIEGETVISTAEGNDRVAVKSSRFADGLAVFSGEGDDFFGTQNTNTEARVFTGNGSDRVSVFNSELSGVVAGQGGDDDQFALNDPSSSAELRVAGFEGDLEFPNGNTQSIFNAQIRSGVALGTVSEVLALDTRLSTVAGAFIATGFGERFDDGRASLSQTSTVFAPTDSAFASLPDGLLDSLTTNELRDILSFHVGIGTNPRFFPTGASLSAAEIIESDLLVTLLEGETIDIEQTAAGLVLDGDAMLVTTDIRAKNGIVHIIDGVLLPG